MTMRVPELRIRLANQEPVQEAGEYVLYWMTASRRTGWNFALQRAVEWARDLRKPLVVFEALRCGYRWASDRLHRFVIEGMLDNAASLQNRPVTYYPYVEPEAGDGRGLLAALAKRAALVVGDEYPCFFLPRMIESAARQCPVRMELVDAGGLLPLRAAERVFGRAFDFRRYLQKHLRPHLAELPLANPLAGLRLPVLEKLPPSITRRWPVARLAALEQPDQLTRFLAKLPIDHGVGPGRQRGGTQAAEATLRTFLDSRLARYATERSDGDADVASGLSPYLHFGHIGAHQVFAQTVERKGWTSAQLATTTSGSSSGWWGTSAATESFLDELITWRELGFNFCHGRSDYDRYESLPAWALATLAKHADDRREHLYTAEEFATARTHDPLWNAAQRQLVGEGRMQNYLRMLWGKKILEWSPSPEQALDVMIELNNRYALDGRDPNSYSGIFWCLGRYDRPWAPERPVYGVVRYMSSQNTVRKLRFKAYLAQYGQSPEERRLF